MSLFRTPPTEPAPSTDPLPRIDVAHRHGIALGLLQLEIQRLEAEAPRAPEKVARWSAALRASYKALAALDDPK